MSKRQQVVDLTWKRYRSWKRKSGSHPDQATKCTTLSSSFLSLFSSSRTSKPADEIKFAFHKIAKDRKVIPDPIDDRKFQE